METHVRTSLELYGHVLRYAEIEQRGPTYRLLRLGSCNFDFDVAHELLRHPHSEHLETVAEATSDVFEGTSASELRIVLHPSDCYSFFTPVPRNGTDLERTQRLQQDAALLTGASSHETLRLATDEVRTETLGDDEVTWVHVVALTRQAQIHFDRMLNMLPQSEYRLMLSPHATAHLLGVDWRQANRAASSDEEQAPFTLAIGWYPSHVEYTLCREDRWYHSHYTEATAVDDCAYFALALLRRVHVSPTDIGRLVVYGEQEEITPFLPLQTMFSPRPALLNPIQVIDLDPRSLASSFTAEAYAPCLGATL